MSTEGVAVVETSHEEREHSSDEISPLATLGRNDGTVKRHRST